MSENNDAIQLGEFYATPVEAFGTTLQGAIYYIHYPAIPGNETDNPEEEYIDILRTFIVSGDRFLRVDPGNEWIEEMESEILDSLK